MDILQYFDNQYTAQESLSDLISKNKLTIIIYIEDLLKLANDRLTDELNWIVQYIQKNDINTFDFTTISKSIRKSLQKSYFDTNNKKTIIDYVLSLTKNDVYNQFIIDKAIEILSVIINEILYGRIHQIFIIFGGFTDLDELIARKRQNVINTLICEFYQTKYIKDLKKKNKYLKSEWNISNITPGTVFMQQVQKQFQRSNLDFIKCQYQLIPQDESGSADQKLCKLLDQQLQNDSKQQILIFARSRQSLLKLLSYCNENEITIFLQQLDIINFPEYELQPINIQRLIQQMYNTFGVSTPNNKKNIIRDFIGIVNLVKNPVIQLPIPVDLMSIPCITAVFRSFIKKQRKQLFNNKFEINIESLIILLNILSSVNEFYDEYKKLVDKSPGLLLLFINNLLLIQKNTIKLKKQEIKRLLHILPDLQTSKTISETQLKQLLKFNDHTFQEPDIVFINDNYIESNKTNIKKHILNHIMIQKQQKHQINTSQYNYKDYIAAIQKQSKRLLINIDISADSNNINVFNYWYSEIPNIQLLIEFLKQQKQDNYYQYIQQFNVSTYLKVQLYAVMAIPTDYMEIYQTGQFKTLHMFSKELQLNITYMQKQFPNLIQPFALFKYNLETQTPKNIPIYSKFIYNLQLRELLFTQSDIKSLFDYLLPYFNKIHIQR